MLGWRDQQSPCNTRRQCATSQHVGDERMHLHDGQHPNACNWWSAPSNVGGWGSEGRAGAQQVLLALLGASLLEGRLAVFHERDPLEVGRPLCKHFDRAQGYVVARGQALCVPAHARMMALVAAAMIIGCKSN